MSAEWVRPADVPFPSIWGEFEGKTEQNGVKRKYWIQDLTDEYKEEFLRVMMNSFLKDEPLCRYADLIDDRVSVEDIKKVYDGIILQNLVLICLTKDENGKVKMAGCNATFPSSKEEPPYVPKGETWTRVFGVVDYVTKMENFLDKYKMKDYLSAMGLVVLPEYRGEGIGLELLKAREPLCKAVGLPATGTCFSSIASQKLAKRVGFEDVSEISYEELFAKYPNLTIPNIQEHTKTCKYMVKIYN